MIPLHPRIPLERKRKEYEIKFLSKLTPTSIIGLVVEFIVAIDEARVRFTDDAKHFFLHYLYITSWDSLCFFLNERYDQAPIPSYLE